MNGYERYMRASLKMFLDLGWGIIAVLICLCCLLESIKTVNEADSLIVLSVFVTMADRVRSS